MRNTAHKRLWTVLFVIFAWYRPALGAGAAEEDPNVEYVTARMSEYKVEHEDAYLCTAVPLPDEPMKLVGIEPLAKQEIAHHMLLFGCEAPASKDKVWECHMVSPCGRGEKIGVSHGEQVMYGWARDAPGMHLPEGAGFSVGPRTGIRTAVLQVHYQIVRPEGDRTGVRLKMTRAPQPRGAGMMMWAAGFSVPPRTPSHLVPNRCCYSGFQPLTGFAFRVHAHALGRRIWMERGPKNPPAGRPAELVVEQDPQEPQGFYPVTQGLRFLPGDSLQVTCEFNSTERDSETHAGSGSKNEMCNMYMMVTSEVPYFMTCGNGYSGVSLAGPGGMHPDSALTPELPARWRPPPARNAGVKAEHLLGQVSGVDAGVETDTVWLLQRGARVWDQATFASADDHHASDATPIPEAAVLQLDKDTGRVLRAWGGGLLVMPHSIAVDPATGHVWVTDVALHQALKFDADGNHLAAIGEKLEPGHDNEHLCKPTAVAFSRTGDVFVADGYCNSRVMQYAADGAYIGQYRLQNGEMSIPHGLVVSDCEGLLYVADREAGAVHHFELLSQPPLPSGQGGAPGGARRLSGPGAEAGDAVRPEAGSWDVKEHGMVYGLTAGPYGSLLALCWNRTADTVALVLLDALHGGEVARVWAVAGVRSPHDLTLTAAPLEVTGAGERTLAVYVAETRPEGSSLRKFILLPEGLTLEVPSGGEAETVASPIAPEVTPKTEPGQAAQGAGSTAEDPAAAAAAADAAVAAAAAAAAAQLPPEVTADVRQQAAAVAEPLVKPLSPPFLGDEEGPSAGEMMMWRALPFAALIVGAVAVVWWRMAPPRRPAQRFHPIPTHETRS